MDRLKEVERQRQQTAQTFDGEVGFNVLIEKLTAVLTDCIYIPLTGGGCRFLRQKNTLKLKKVNRNADCTHRLLVSFDLEDRLFNITFSGRLWSKS